MKARGRPFLMLSAALLMGLSSCALSPKRSQDADGAAEPPPASSSNSARALLLDTGAIQLGPGLGKNAYRWLGDGEWGF